METYRKAKIIILPTEIKTVIRRNTYKFTEAHGNPLEYMEIDNLPDAKRYQDRGYEFQHLYITTDEEIKEGDCYLQWLDNKWLMSQADCHSVRNIKNFTTKEHYGKKIIATTDKSLKVWSENTVTSPNLNISQISLPQPSQAFIKKYCEEGGIDEVLIEYKHMKWADHFTPDRILELVPKVDSHNTITIHPIKDSWGREEVIELCETAWLNGFTRGLKEEKNPNNYDEKSWVKENL